MNRKSVTFFSATECERTDIMSEVVAHVVSYDLELSWEKLRSGYELVVSGESHNGVNEAISFLLGYRAAFGLRYQND